MLLKEVDRDLFMINSLDARLGAGTFGSVYRGIYKDPETQRQIEVAVKTFNNRQYRDLEIEASLMQKLDHPNIVKVIKTGYSATQGFYIAMELCETTLKGFLAKQGLKKFSEKEASVFFKDICLGVKYLQVNGIIHRDIKLENIMIDKHLVIKIGDFGLAKLIDDDITNTTCGSTHIMAPEILKKTAYGKESDLWSLGVLLFGMITGEECLYKGIGRLEYERRIKHFVQVDFPGHTELTPEAKDLIAKMLTADPKKRATIDEVLAHPWFAKYQMDDELLCSNVVLLSYMESDDLSQKLISQLRDHINQRLTQELKSRAKQSFDSLTAFKTYFKDASKYLNKDQVNTFMLAILDMSENLMEKKAPGSIITLDNLIGAKKSRPISETILSYRKHLQSTLTAEERSLTSNQIQNRLADTIFTLSCTSRPSEGSEASEKVSQTSIYKLLSSALHIMMHDAGDTMATYTVHPAMLHSYCDQYKMAIADMCGLIEEFLATYVYAYSDDTENNAYGDIVEVTFADSRSITPQVYASLKVLKDAIDRRISTN